MRVLKKNLKFLALSVFCLALFFSCKKYEEGPVFAFRTVKARLTGTWKLKTVLFNNKEKLNFANEDALHTFESNGAYIISEENTLGSNGTQYGSWDFADKKSFLFLDIASDQTVYTIKRLKNQSMWLEKESGGNLLLYKYKKE